MHDAKIFGANFVAAIRPPMNGCPIKSGEYNLSKAEVNLNFVATLPLENHYWNIFVYIYEEAEPLRELIACLSAYVRVMPSSQRGKKRIGKNKS